MDPEKIEAIMNWPTPRKVIDVRNSMGLAGYYRRFIEEFIQGVLGTLIPGDCR